MHAVRERANLVGEIDELGAQPAHAALELAVAIVRKRRQLVQRLPKERDALDHVVVQFPGDAGALLFLCREQLPAEGSRRRQISPLLDNDRRNNGRGQDSSCQGGSDEDPPELGCRRSHRMPHVVSEYERILTAPYAW